MPLLHSDLGDKKVALVTGAAHGVGKAVVQRLEQDGFHVIAADRRRDFLEALESENVTAVELDVTDTEQVEAALSFIVQYFGRLDVLVNAHVQVHFGCVEEDSVEAAQSLFCTNYFGVVRVVKSALPFMREAGSGTIVNVMSMMSYMSTPFMGQYAASRHALRAFNESLRMELEPFGVHVAAVRISEKLAGSEEVELLRYQSHRKVHAYHNMVQAFVKWWVHRMDKPRNSETVADLVSEAVHSAHPKRYYTAGLIYRWYYWLQDPFGSAAGIDRLFQRLFRRG